VSAIANDEAAIGSVQVVRQSGGDATTRPRQLDRRPVERFRADRWRLEDGSDAEQPPL